MDPTLNKEAASQRQDQLLTTLERLLALSATEVNATLNQVAQLVAEVLTVDKVDIFFHDPANDTLVALGNSDTPMGRRQRAIGMDRLPIANGGRTVEVFLSGKPYLTGHADQDPDELVGLKVGLGVKSEIGTVFKVQTTLFHPFMGGSGSTGLGLGLYLANRIAEAHGGKLTIESQEDQGVRVSLALPVEDEELVVREHDAPASSSQTSAER